MCTITQNYCSDALGFLNNCWPLGRLPGYKWLQPMSARYWNKTRKQNICELATCSAVARVETKLHSIYHKFSYHKMNWKPHTLLHFISVVISTAQKMQSQTNNKVLVKAAASASFLLRRIGSATAISTSLKHTHTTLWLWAFGHVRWRNPWTKRSCHCPIRPISDISKFYWCYMLVMTHLWRYTVGWLWFNGTFTTIMPVA